jgi:hypothetical protein
LPTPLATWSRQRRTPSVAALWSPTAPRKTAAWWMAVAQRRKMAPAERRRMEGGLTSLIPG